MIRSCWAKILANKLDCLIDYKNESLKNIKCSTKHINYPMYNNVVLDNITNIEMIDD